MEPVNPYQAPEAAIDNPVFSDEFDQSHPFAARGRFSRLSYIAWSMSIGFAIALGSTIVLGTTAATMGSGAGAAWLTVGGNLVTQVLVLAATIIFGVRRLHDTGASGWWYLLVLIPLVNIVFYLFLILKSGDPGTNRFAPPRPTRTWEKVVGYIWIGLLALGIGVMIIGFAATS